jgi:hypothetical protein
LTAQSEVSNGHPVLGWKHRSHLKTF